MQHPFQCLANVSFTAEDSRHTTYLLAACGPTLFCSASSSDSDPITHWSAAPQSESKDATNGDAERPSKRQKTDHAPAHRQSSTIINVTVVPDSQHVVAVTEDKNIYVLQITSEGQLLELSQRCMPKRPSSIQISSDSTTIFCGDKFGDVYSLPLLPSEADEDFILNVVAEPVFKPAANNFTIHTHRNRKALEAQQKQKNFTPRKEPLKFRHQLLLGHVAMLTDMQLAVQHVGKSRRRYIITADRDEHIRISRAPPQSHIIEGFCLGHAEFVSKLCLIPQTEILISGGGDTWLGVWNWPASRLLGKIDLLQFISDKAEIVPNASDFHITVSGLWIADVSETDQALIVMLEKVNALFAIPLAHVRALLSGNPVATHSPTTIALPEHPIDVSIMADRTIIVSLDARSQSTPRLHTFHLSTLTSNESASKVAFERVTQDDKLFALVDTLNKSSTTFSEDKALDDLLYGLGKLRKRSGDHDPNINDADVTELADEDED